MSSNRGLELAKAGIDQLIEEVKQQIAKNNNLENQISIISTAVNNFVLQTLQAVHDNSDLPEVNEILANSLIQIKDFVNERPSEITKANIVLNEKLDAYQQCNIIISESSSAIKEKIEQKQSILEHIDESGKYSKRRKSGERPEKVADVRKVEEEIAAQNNFQEDI